MKTYIRLENGSAIGNPILENNMKLLFSDFDPESPPWPYAIYLKDDSPEDPYSVLTTTLFSYDANIKSYIEHKIFRPMSSEERQSKIDSVKSAGHPFKSWVFNEATCAYEPPIPKPKDGEYYWDELKLEWIKIEV